MRFDLFLYAWIDICGSSIYMYAVRFIFARFDLFFAVLILNERFICARLILDEPVLKTLSVTERHTFHCPLFSIFARVHCLEKS